MCMHRGKVEKGHSNKLVICKPRTEASGETKSPYTMILDSSLQHWVKINFSCLSHESVVFYCGSPSKLVQILFIYMFGT